MHFIYHIAKNFYFIDDSIHKIENKSDLPSEYYTWRPNKTLNNFENTFCSYYKRDSSIPNDIYKKHNIDNFYKIIKMCNLDETHENLFLSMNKNFVRSYMTELSSLCKNLHDSGLYYDKGYNLPYKIIIETEKYNLNLDSSYKKNKKLSFHPYTTTYRLANESGYFPLYNLKKDERVNIKPNNDFFLEFDYNAAEFRIFLNSVNENFEDVDDLYEETKHLFNVSTREEAKQKYFETAYSGMAASDTEIYSLLKKLTKKVYNGTFITTDYGNRVYCEDIKNVASYYNQTSCSFLVYEKALEIVQFIKLMNLETKFCFTFHDAIILDLKINELPILKPILKNLVNTRFGKIPGKFKLGVNYRDMKEIKI
jgi:hypothetical protein